MIGVFTFEEIKTGDFDKNLPNLYQYAYIICCKEAPIP